MDYYQLLGCSPADDIALIKKKYQELIVKHHPDKSGSEETSELFLAVNSAWRILSNNADRRRYDAELANNRLVTSQESAIWCQVPVEDLKAGPATQLSFACKCGGSYSAPEADIRTQLQEDSELLMECDSCSFSILIVRS